MESTQVIALISAVAALFTSIAALSTAVIQIVISKSNQRATHELELSKLFFHSKEQAYCSFLSALQDFSIHDSTESFHKLKTSCTYAMIFSSESTSEKMEHFGILATRYHFSPDTPEIQEAYHLAQKAAVEAMRTELTQLNYDLNK